RKPAPGMLLAAAERLPLQLATSWIVGDRATDIEAGRNAGLAGGIHVATGYGADEGERQRALAFAGDDFRALAAPSIAEAAHLLPLFANAAR
ncbi:MAG: HAD hydrolase-like protein, partial [Rhodospirillales bacterium]